MYLKGLEIQGFKSFADKISLDFNKGITAIVGPNGSGKSNISDAILWVLGEQSAKTLRGNKMEDVIFAGTEKRHPLGFAEVSLLLDNSTGMFPLDFPEVKVTRKVYRSGESEYRINGTACRLKDIHELFMDTGLGRDGYSIIGQGKISDILSSKSENRRQIFEEAAGITKYKYRKIEAEKKLAQTKDNLIRLKDIISEIEAQITPLKTQSEKAKKYLTLYEKLKELEIGISVISIASLRENIKKSEADIEIYEKQLEEIKSSIQKIDTEISEMYESVKRFDEETEELRSRENDEIHEANELSNKINIYLNSIKHNEENIARLSEEIKSDRLLAEKLNEEISECNLELNKTKEQLVLCDDEIGRINSELEKFKKIQSENSESVQRIQNDISEKKNFITYETARIENGSELKASLDERIKRLENDISQRNSECERLKNEADDINKRIENEEKLKEESKSSYAALNDKRVRLGNECDALIKAKNELMLNINRCESRRNILIDMDNEMEGYSKSVKSIMRDYKNGKIQGACLYGPLSMLISTDARYVTAVEVALGAAGQNIVTESEEDAKLAIEHLKKNKLGRATFLPVSAVKGRTLDENGVHTQAGFISIASELVRTDAKFSDIIKSILGKTVVVDNMDNAISMSRRFKNRFRIVTLSGEILQAGGAITGGSIAKTNGFLSRNTEIEKLKADIENYRKELNITAQRISEYTDKISEYDNKLKAVLKEQGRIDENIMRLKVSLDGKKTELENNAVVLENFNAELNDTALKLEKIDDDFKDGKLLIEKREKEVLELENKLSDALSGLDGINSEFETLNNSLVELNIKRNGLLKDIEVIEEKLESKTKELELNEKGIDIKANELNSLNSKIASMNEEIIEFREKLKELEENTKSSRQRIEELILNKKQTEDKIQKYQEDSKSVRENMIGITDTKNKQESRRAKLEYDLESIINHIWEEYEITYNDMLNGDTLEITDTRQANNDITDLKQQIKALGSINIDAIEEYKALKERYEFLSEQISDLDEGREKLETAIEEMLVVMKQQFSEKFAIINTRFNSVFNELFGGGRAKLYLTEPDNILDSGIEIEAQPPGKKLQSLTLLSGGERAFTAIALLFAILEVRPTPFCILDEIEAALDDVNVYRYADYLKKYCNKTQFIVVTHRRGTMEAANIMYGVTMQEKGVSKLLALNIDEVAM